MHAYKGQNSSRDSCVPGIVNSVGIAAESITTEEVKSIKRCPNFSDANLVLSLSACL